MNCVSYRYVSRERLRIECILREKERERERERLVKPIQHISGKRIRIECANDELLTISCNEGFFVYTYYSVIEIVYVWILIVSATMTSTEYQLVGSGTTLVHILGYLGYHTWYEIFLLIIGATHDTYYWLARAPSMILDNS